MRKLFIAALVLAAGCDATRRDYSVCDVKYSTCHKGFTCNLELGLCVPETDAGPTPSDAGPGDETAPPVDVTPGEATPSDAKDAPAIDVAPVDGPTGVDGLVTDVPLPVDVVPPDTRVPDAPGSCLVDNDCTGSEPHYCVNAKCVSCRTSNQCNNDAGAPFCSAQNTCVSCAASTGDGGVCSGTAPVCDPGSGRCVECMQNSECPTAAKAFCVSNKCQGCNVAGASAGGIDGGVSDGGSSDGGVLGACIGTKPVCATSGSMLGQCVQCMTSADCSGSTPICNTGSNTCMACTTDSQCASIPGGPGICMFHQDGRCASDAETIYVQNSTSCGSGSSAGTSATPFCNSQDAINAITAQRRLLAMIGSTLYPITSTSMSSSGQISIVGKSTATTAAGAYVGIHVTALDVYIRNLTIANGGNSGLVVERGATLRLDRCIIKGNTGGGLIVQSGANFDIANSVFDDNGPGQVGTTVTFGGVYLGGSPPSSGPHRLWFSTIVNNQDRGVICFDTSQALTGMLLYGNVNGGYLSCAMDSTNSKWDSPGAGSDVSDPAFSKTNPYHLTSSSKCKDFIDASLAHPADDIDGDVRPKPTTGKLDCGADEF